MLHGGSNVAFLVTEVWVECSEPMALTCPGRMFGKPCLPLLEVVKGCVNLEVWLFLESVGGDMKGDELGVVLQNELPKECLER